MRRQAVDPLVERAIGQAPLRGEIDQRGLVAAHAGMVRDPVEISEAHCCPPGLRCSFGAASGATIQTGGTYGVNAPDTSSSPRRRGPILRDIDVLDSFWIVLHCCAITAPAGVMGPRLRGDD